MKFSIARSEIVTLDFVEDSQRDRARMQLVQAAILWVVLEGLGWCLTRATGGVKLGIYSKAIYKEVANSFSN